MDSRSDSRRSSIESISEDDLAEMMANNFGRRCSLTDGNSSDDDSVQTMYTNNINEKLYYKENRTIQQINAPPTMRFVDEIGYRMDNAKRGTAIIINNKKFHPALDMPARNGTDKDAACLQQTFCKLGFNARIEHNKSASEMRDILTRLAKADHSDSDAFICCILSHGEDGIVYGTDQSIEVDQLVAPFKYNRSLAGKPKLFFIQACRGTKLMDGIDTNPYKVNYVSKIPMEADFLIAYSTISGFYSWRNSVNGSWFIQSLCDVFNTYGNQLEIMQLLTCVNRRVAYYYESNSNDSTMNGKRQVPCIVSMLTKELYFKPKSDRQISNI